MSTLSALLLVLAPLTVAANPPPVQIYYVPLPENQVFDALQTIFPEKNACHITETPEILG